LAALEAEHQSHFGLAPEQADTVHGPGDETILAALGVLFALRERGVVRAIGIAGYPLPTLLRLARLARARLGRPLDLVQSYSHLTLQNRALLAYVPLLRDAGVASVVNASPLSMGLLRAGPSPAWHPAPATLRAVVRECGVAKPEAASFRYGLRAGWDVGVPTVTGCSTVAELEMALEAYGDGGAPAEDEEASTLRSAIEGAGYADWSWPSPPTATARSRQEK
jgi:aryl-alcohol dehydrogenase-like predicted oxidoreductase